MTRGFSNFRFRDCEWDFSKPYVMGILNVTPDSFSDGGVWSTVDAALRWTDEMAPYCDVIDVGGESTRPGATPVDTKTELARVLPIIEAITSRFPGVVSIDTTKSEVARAAVEHGAQIVNDISGGLFDPAMSRVVAQAQATYVCGHLLGKSIEKVHAHDREPSVAEVIADLRERLAGFEQVQVVVDPGLGFGKRGERNLELLRASPEISRALARPILVGPSRKRFIGDLVGGSPVDRDAASVGCALAAIVKGAHIVRMHEPKLAAQVTQGFLAVMQAGGH